MRNTSLIVGLTLGATIVTAPMAAIAAEESDPSVGPRSSQSQLDPSPDVNPDPAPDSVDPPVESPAETPRTETTPSSEPPATIVTNTPKTKPRPEVTAASSGPIALSTPQAGYGDTVVVTGSVAPDATQPIVTVERLSRTGTWQQVGTAQANVQGRWAISSRAEFNTEFRAHLPGGVSPQVRLTVLPKLTFTRAVQGPTLAGAKLTATVVPTQYTGLASVVVTPKQGKSASTTGQIRSGHLNVQVPTNFVGQGKVTVTLPAANGMAPASATTRIRATTRKLRVGSEGEDVRALVKHLKTLRFHTPRVGKRYTNRVGDVVLAFRKAHRMTRAKTMNRKTWQAVAAAKPMTPRRKLSGTYIEVDKTRQIMMVVRNSKVIGTMHVSTGKTGNTPEGRFRVYQRGGSYLYRFMAFVGNYGIHGYDPVPLSPASHGCVREPMWAADWTWSKTKHGSPVYIYR